MTTVLHARNCSRPRSAAAGAIACWIAVSLMMVADGRTYGVESDFATVGFSSTCGPDVIPRFFHKAVLLPDGQVLVAGGLGLTMLPPGLTSLTDISLFDPLSRQFSQIRSVDGAAHLHLIVGRSSHTMTTLPDGRVLIAGGNVDAGGRSTGRATETTEIVDPAKGRIHAGPAMNEPRAYHSATRLSDNRVLVAGGASWQIFDPTDDAWSSPVKMVRSRTRHAAVLLPAEHASLTDRVLVIGGLGAGGRWLEILDPAMMTSRQIPAMLPEYVNDLAAARMSNGRVLIVGGQINHSLQTKSYVLIFDPVDESLRELPPLPLRKEGISDHEMMTVGNYVIVFGGEQQVGQTDTELDYVAIFNGESESWEFVGAMQQPRDDFVAVRLTDDRVLLIGGALSMQGNEAPTGTAEEFELRQVLIGDVNGDGRITQADVGPFVDVLLSPDDADAIEFRAADMNADFAVDGRDIIPFQSKIAF
ncbi:MAG: hypothetical protein H6818_23900 [Phycisphaerales bacterium]|nr:hypothetical protein [Phycisphaerales bacterium]